jgi:hypothetical protein
VNDLKIGPSVLLGSHIHEGVVSLTYSIVATWMESSLTSSRSQYKDDDKEEDGTQKESLMQKEHDARKAKQQLMLILCHYAIMESKDDWPHLLQAKCPHSRQCNVLASGRGQ